MFNVLLQTPTQVAEYSQRNVLCNRKDRREATQDEGGEIERDGYKKRKYKIEICERFHVLIINMKCL